jgi:hypothetical protein
MAKLAELAMVALRIPVPPKTRAFDDARLISARQVPTSLVIAEKLDPD